MKIVITGSSTGIGRATALKFLAQGHEVHGIDILGCSIDSLSYTHHLADVSEVETLPQIDAVNILVNNAGVQDSGQDIKVNLNGTINATRTYGLQSSIYSILNMSCVSAHNGCEFDEFVASKGGVLSYTKWTAKEIAKYGATCNSLSFGGVFNSLNDSVTCNADLWNRIMSQTPLKRWCTCEEAAEWIYMFTVLNRSCSGQDLIIDNLESLNNEFIW